MEIELFTQPFCAPCRSAKLVVQRVLEQHPGVPVRTIDVVADPAAGARARIASTPTVRVLQAGREALRIVGVPRPAALAQALDELS
ncbi:thioredoxin family protein [Glutamicibacter endophyticus]|uniref:thioredoxin family protein n=1 Tax=Glutamicibacter endophyticus TaxID=1522174 RepID=UPI003AF00399